MEPRQLIIQVYDESHVEPTTDDARVTTVTVDRALVLTMPDAMLLKDLVAQLHTAANGEQPWRAKNIDPSECNRCNRMARAILTAAQGLMF